MLITGVSAIFFEPHLAGTGGDMLIAALLAIGADERVIINFPSIPEKGVFSVSVHPRTVIAHGIKAIYLDIQIQEEPLHRKRSEMMDILDASISALKVSETVRKNAKQTLDLIFRAEAVVHGGTLDTVHLHEVGGFDTVLDVLGYFVLLEKFGNPKIFSSFPSVGGGIVNTAHGVMSVPVPAVCAIAAETGYRCEAVLCKRNC